MFLFEIRPYREKKSMFIAAESHEQAQKAMMILCKGKAVEKFQMIDQNLYHAGGIIEKETKPAKKSPGRPSKNKEEAKKDGLGVKKAEEVNMNKES